MDIYTVHTCYDSSGWVDMTREVGVGNLVNGNGHFSLLSFF